jgi:NAD(P)H-flavin reductase
VSLAIGAGKPNIPTIPNILVKGVKTASDFLMSLQLLGATRKNILSNLQIRLPVVIIGGGLTSIDTATESLAYYPVMVSKIYEQYKQIGDSLFEDLDEEEKEIFHEFISHAKALRDNPTRHLELVKSWGGVKIIYRKKLEDSPAYKLNHEELKKAFEEGIEFLDETTPIEITVDKYGNCDEIICNNQNIRAKSIFIATGTVPNTSLAREYVDNFTLEGRYFKMIDQKLNIDGDEKFFTTMDDDGFSTSVLRDSHPEYSGSVVKAMASAKDSYKSIAKIVLNSSACNIMPTDEFFQNLDELLIAKVIEVKRLNTNVIELLVKSPLAAMEFKPGEFYRLQNYEANQKAGANYAIVMEPLALTGALVDKKNGVISLIILEMGGSSSFCQYLKPKEVISLMGPTGSPTYIPHNKKVILIGGGLGNAVLLSIGKALRQNGCYVLYFAGYKKQEDMFKIEEIEKVADQVVWCCDEKELDVQRSEDKTFHGNIVQALESYNDMRASADFELKVFEHIITIGSDSMMKAVAYTIYNSSKSLFKVSVKAIASINSPMQCMMKEICGQCIQKHVDPETKEVSYVYSCFNQDQEMKYVDFHHLTCRLKQNSLMEKITSNIVKRGISTPNF